MDSIFNLEETKRSSLLQQIIESFGFTYVCLWSHFHHHSNCLIFIDGVYKEENNQASSSSGSLAMQSFIDYKKSMFLIDNYSGRVPGSAFMQNLPYMELKRSELLKMASNEAQLQFYQEARIKTAIFMGCGNGEIELGMSNDSTQINFEVELKKLFPGDFPQEVATLPLDQTRPSSSSSSLRSLSMENSADYPPFFFNMLHDQTSNMAEIYGFTEPYMDQQAPSSSTVRSEDSIQQTLIQIRANQMIASKEHEEATMTRAILAAISSTPSSSSPPSSSSHQRQAPRVASAFNRYRTYLGPTKRVQNRQSLNQRSLSFFKNLNEARAQQQYQMVQTTRPTSNQLHHMMSERKRREKLNESFQALRSVLPPGSKKDKASVLFGIKEYISSLKSQVEELNKRNKILEAKHSRNEETSLQESSGISSERLVIGLTDVEESTSESQSVELEVNLRADVIIGDLVVRILEFMKQVEDVTIMSIDARTQLLETQAIANRVVLRLRIQGSEWDRSNFQEAIKRVLDDLAQ